MRKIYSNNPRVKWLLLTIFMLAVQQLSAQSTLSGKVTSENKEGLPGVSVSVKGTTKGTTTAADGRYTLSGVEANGTLVFSFIGYVSEEVAVGNRSTVDVQLLPDLKSLSEVVVVGYGTQEKKDVTGSIGSVDMKTLSDVPLQTADQALQGRLAGVDVQSNSGLPGGGMKVNIRGLGTVNNSDPLYVIDGFYPGNINSLNPNDIAAIDVLKDASASAIYGVLGANGVVIITTKRAKSGKPTITFDSYWGTQQPRKYLDLLGTRDYATVSNNAKDNALADDNAIAFQSGKPGNIAAIGSSRVPVLANLEKLPRYGQVDNFGFKQPAGEPGQVAGELIDVDWQRQVFRTAPTRNHNLTIAGGTENARILASLGYLKQDGILKGSGFERISARINADVNYNKFKFGTSLYFASEKRQQNASGRTYSSPTRASPSLAVYNSDSTYTLGYNGNERERDGQDGGNPLRDLIINDQVYRNYLGYISTFMEYEIIPGLKYKLNVGADLNLGVNNEYFPTFRSSSYDLRAPDQNSLSQSSSRGISLLAENTLTYERIIEKHKFSVLAGYVARRGDYTFFGANKLGFPVGDLIRVADAGRTVANYGGGASSNRQVGIIGRINYDYANKYLLTVNVRRDGSSRFGKDYRFGVFPSASVGWRLSQEEFLKNVPFISDLKLRAGWGKIGNQEIGDYRYSGVVNNFSNYLFGQSFTSSGGTITNAVNPALRWETTTQTNIGLDFGLLNNRLSFTVDYFDKITSDILLVTPIPASTGYDEPPTVNIGKVKNNGLELSGSYQQQSGDFTWNLGGNISFVKNRVLELNGGNSSLGGAPDPSNGGNSFITRTEAGHPIGAFYGFAVEKVFQNNTEIYYNNAIDGNSGTTYGGTAIRPGDYKFKDINNDGVIDAKDRTYIGSPMPNFTYGIFGRAEYKGFDVQVQFQGVQGSQIYNATRYWMEGMQRNFNYDSRTLNRWISESNPGNGEVPRANSNDANNSQVSNRYIENGSYLRLKNLTLGYNFGKGALGMLKGLANLRVYATASNLLTITKYTGYDPEVGASYNADPNANGPSKANLNRNVDNASYPIPKMFLVGVQVGF